MCSCCLHLLGNTSLNRYPDTIGREKKQLRWSAQMLWNNTTNIQICWIATLKNTKYNRERESGKWDFFYHFLDLSVINAWLLYKRVSQQNGTNPKNLLNLAAFRVQLSVRLCKMGESLVPKCEKPSSLLQNDYNVKREALHDTNLLQIR